ncbi:MAG TPA: tetratricopeptide repeat protein [Bryobacteraceae bacterium]|nr:tetratricopeptide repeat protein [Bryobacteraceae bacterium]
MWLASILLLVSFDTARQYQANGQFQAAELAYREVLKEQPQSVPALTNLGVVLAHQSRYGEAIAEYKKALAIDSTATPARVNLALAYYRLSDWPHAAAYFEQLLKQAPGDRRSLQLLAVCDFQMRRFAEAVEVYRRLIPSDDPSVLIGLSSALREAGQRAESERLLSATLEKYPDTPEVHYLLGLAQFARQSYVDAALSFRKVTSLAPSRVEGYFYLGATYLKQRKVEEAIDTWKEATHIDPRYFPATFALGSVLADLGRNDQAKMYLENAFAQRPDDPAVELALGQLYLHQAKVSAALPLLQRASAADPRSKEASFLLASAYQKLGRKQEATAEFRRSRELFAEDATQNMLAEATRVDHETGR